MRHSKCVLRFYLCTKNLSDNEYDTNNEEEEDQRNVHILQDSEDDEDALCDISEIIIGPIHEDQLSNDELDDTLIWEPSEQLNNVIITCHLQQTIKTYRE